MYVSWLLPKECTICYLRWFKYLWKKCVVFVNISNQLYCQYSNPAPITTNKLEINTVFFWKSNSYQFFCGWWAPKPQSSIQCQSISQLGNIYIVSVCKFDSQLLEPCVCWNLVKNMLENMKDWSSFVCFFWKLVWSTLRWNHAGTQTIIIYLEDKNHISRKTQWYIWSIRTCYFRFKKAMIKEKQV